MIVRRTKWPKARYSMYRRRCSCAPTRY